MIQKRRQEEDFLQEDIEQDDMFLDDLKDDFPEDDDQTYDDFDTNFSRDAQVQHIWLDTEPYLNNIYLSLTNQEVKKYYKNVNGVDKILTKLEQIPETKPLANNQGISQIMGRLKGMISKDLVQGNLNLEQYNDFLYWFLIKVKRMLIVNRINWGIKIEDLNTICDIIIDSVTIYLTRPIQNLERDRDKTRAPQESNEPKGFMQKIGFMRNKNKGYA